MYTLSISLSFLSVFGLYANHKRTEPPKKGVAKWLSEKSVTAYLLAICTFSFSTYFLILEMGIVVGILTSVSLWMLIASLIQLFTPFQKVKSLHLAFVCIGCLFIEFILIN